MYQRQINKLSKGQICMLGSSTLEQPFSFRIRFFFFNEIAACSLLTLKASNKLLSLFLFFLEINVGFHPCTYVFTLLG